jgi:hypothetical protein
MGLFGKGDKSRQKDNKRKADKKQRKVRKDLGKK